MSSYPDRYQKDDFTTHVSITHNPTNFKFVQSGGRVLVLKQREFDQIWAIFSDFSTEALQIEHTVLTEAALRRAAINWLKGHLK